MQIYPSDCTLLHCRLQRILLLSGLIVSASACSAFTEEPIPLRTAEIEQLVAPEHAAIGATIMVQLRVNSGCAEFSHVEQMRTGQRISFQAWAQERDHICGTFPNFRDVRERLQLDQVGLWELEAGEQKVQIEVE